MCIVNPKLVRFNAPKARDVGDLRLRLPSQTPQVVRCRRQDNAMPHCDFRVPMENRWRLANFEFRFLGQPLSSSPGRLAIWLW